MKVLTVALCCLAVTAFAASPVASVSSASDFTLRGAKVVAAGVTSWPVLAGDGILTGSSPARVRFQDGTVVNLGPASNAKLEQTSDGMLFRLISGAMTYTVSANSTVSMFSGQSSLQATPGVEATAAVGASPSAGSRGSVSLTLGGGSPPKLSRR